MSSNENQAVVVEVTPDDIRNGQRDDCMNCPIARALNRAFNLSPAVVDLDSFYFLYGYGSHQLPEEVTEFIVNFDDGQEAEPICFVVPVGPYDFFPAGHCEGRV